MQGRSSNSGVSLPRSLRVSVRHFRFQLSAKTDHTQESIKNGIKWTAQSTLWKPDNLNLAADVRTSLKPKTRIPITKTELMSNHLQSGSCFLSREAGSSQGPTPAIPELSVFLRLPVRLRSWRLFSRQKIGALNGNRWLALLSVATCVFCTGPWRECSRRSYTFPPPPARWSSISTEECAVRAEVWCFETVAGVARTRGTDRTSFH